MNFFINSLFLIIFVVIHSLCIAQSNTVGLLYIDDNATEGYTLFSPEENENVYLIDDCGALINSWTFSEKPGKASYLLANGNLLRAGLDSLEIRGWDNSLMWSYAMTANGLNQHHDIEPLPNGNILCIVADVYTALEMTQEGRNPAITNPNFKLDKIVEIEPVGNSEANVVWEWRFIDHIVQDFDNSKPNYGIVQNNPQLMNINYDNGYYQDWIHLNGIDYNASLDQIILSSRHLDELYIIDHSTTTAEASGHTGGAYNKGGDFLWRWGNPQVYSQGNANDQKLFKQHNGEWVKAGYSDEGKITVFNNYGDGSGTYSSIHLIAPEINNNNYTMDGNLFLPLDFHWSWNGSILGDLVSESKKSATHGLPNGNFIICETSAGRISEIQPDGTLMWCYVNPSAATTIHNQFDVVSENSIFKADKYPSDFLGFLGQDMSPGGIIENQNSVSDSCMNTTSLESNKSNPLIIVNPSMDGFIRFRDIQYYNSIIVTDLLGKIVYNVQEFYGDRLPIQLSPGNYIIRLSSIQGIKNKKITVR